MEKSWMLSKAFSIFHAVIDNERLSNFINGTDS